MRKSQPIGIQDCWIAATALSYGLELVTHNPRDFANIPGLAIITEAPWFRGNKPLAADCHRAEFLGRIRAATSLSHKRE